MNTIQLEVSCIEESLRYATDKNTSPFDDIVDKIGVVEVQTQVGNNEAVPENNSRENKQSIKDTRDLISFKEDESYHNISNILDNIIQTVLDRKKCDPEEELIRAILEDVLENSLAMEQCRKKIKLSLI